MNNATKPRHPVGDALRARLPEYFEWFERWREMRNRVKVGAGFGLVWPDGELALSFTRITAEGGLSLSGDPSLALRVGHVVEALDISGRAALAIATLAASNEGVSESPDG
jgi:hypothetical protein